MADVCRNCKSNCGSRRKVRLHRQEMPRAWFHLVRIARRNRPLVVVAHVAEAKRNRLNKLNARHSFQSSDLLPKWAVVPKGSPPISLVSPLHFAAAVFSLS